MKTLLTICLAAVTTLSLRAQDTTVVTFSVDMNGVDTFDRTQDVLRVAGAFQGWMPMTGDSSNILTDPDSNGVFAVTVPVTESTFEYKYVINNWNGNGERTSNELFGDDRGDCVVADQSTPPNYNRVATVDLTMDSLQLPIYNYDSCTVSSRAIVGTSSTRNLGQLAGVSLAPNPMTSSATVVLPRLAGERFLVSVYGTDGRLAAAARNVSGTTFAIDRGDLSRGLYLVDVIATEAGQRATLRLVVE